MFSCVLLYVSMNQDKIKYHNQMETSFWVVRLVLYQCVPSYICLDFKFDNFISMYRKMDWIIETALPAIIIKIWYEKPNGQCSVKNNINQRNWNCLFQHGKSNIFTKLPSIDEVFLFLLYFWVGDSYWLLKH